MFEAYLAKLRLDPEPEWDPRTLEVLGMMPNYYLQYFYHTDRKLKSQEQWPPSRGEEVIEIEKDLLKMYADPSLVEPPAELMQRGGAYYSTVATQLLNAHYNDLGETHVVTAPMAGQCRAGRRIGYSRCPAGLTGTASTPYQLSHYRRCALDYWHR